MRCAEKGRNWWQRVPLLDKVLQKETVEMKSRNKNKEVKREEGEKRGKKKLGLQRRRSRREEKKITNYVKKAEPKKRLLKNGFALG